MWLVDISQEQEGLSMTKILTGTPLPNIPWEEKPASAINSPVWRYSGNPVIDRNPVKGVTRHLQQRRRAV